MFRSFNFSSAAHAPRKCRRRSPVLPLALALGALVAFPHSARAGSQPGLDELPDTDPDVQLQAFQLADGLEINLFASEPMVRNPVQMNWDDRGRLWVVCSTTYPHIVPGEEADDQIVILEDTTGDGRADRSTVFATGLHIPTGILPVPGGALVANSTEVLLLEDTTGDDKADKRTVILSGFGTEDTHHLLHTFRMGPAGRIHFKQSIYIHSHVETPYGVRRLLGGGLWHFHLPSRRLEVFYKGLINPWGLAFDWRGQAFATDGAGSQGIHDVFPGAIYRTSPGASRVLDGLNPGQPKLCGLDVIESPHWPEDWQNTLVTCDFRGGRVNRFQVTPSGSSHRSVQQPDLLSSTHRAFRPVDILQGPDGALYIADWYNPIIQHGEVDFRDPRRDREHGRIWRLTRKDAPLDRQPEFRSLDEPALAEQLGKPNRWTRDFTRRELGTRDPDKVRTALSEWLAAPAPEDGIAPWRRLLEAALVGGHLDQPDAGLLERLLAHEEPAARAGALRILYYYPDRDLGLHDRITEAVLDEDPSVRLAALAVLREWRTPEGMAIALRVLRKDVDTHIDFLLETMAREQQAIWLPELLAGNLDLDPDAMVFALGVGGGEAAVDPLMANLFEGGMEGEARAGAMRVLARAGTEAQLTRLFDWLMTQPQDEALMRAGLESMRMAAAEREIVPSAEARARLAGLLDAESPVVRELAVGLVGWWKLTDAGERLVALAGDPEGGSLAVAAMDSLARLGGDEARQRLAALAAADVPLQVRMRAARAMLEVNHRLASTTIIEVAQAAAGQADQTAAMWTALFQNQGATNVFGEVLEGAELPTDVAAEALRVASVRGVAEEITGALQKAGNVQRMDRQLTEEELREMIVKVGTDGDPFRGQRIYRRTELQCVVCHAIGGAGGVIGPDLISLGASAPVDYIIESMLEPSAVIKEGYHMTVVTTDGGEVFAGGLVLDGDQEVVIRDAAGVEHTIPTARVTSKTISPVSMMPPGLTNNLREDEFIDLIRFMAELGKDGDFNIGREPVVRSWRKLFAVDPAQVETVRHGGLDFLETARDRFTWAPITSLVSGNLPLAEVPAHPPLFPWRPKVVQFDVEVSGDAPVVLEINDPEGIIVIAGARLHTDPGQRLELQLPPGTHPITLVVQTGIGDPDRELRVKAAQQDASAGVTR